MDGLHPDLQAGAPRNPDSLWENFKKQSLPGYKPTLSAQVLALGYLLTGCLFVGTGVFLLGAAGGVPESSKDYTDEKVNDNKVGSFDLTIENDMEPPIYMYYHLDGFFQGHRRYVASRNIHQLRADSAMPMTADGLTTCNPLKTSADGRPLYPCGLVANSVFNDTFALTVVKDGKPTLLKIDSSAEAIADPSDLQGKFKNLDPEKDDNQKKLDMWILQRFPPVDCVQVDFSEEYVPVSVATKEIDGPDGKKVNVADCTGYTSENPTCHFVRKGEPFECSSDAKYKVQKNKDWGVENGHFMSWMRVAGLPTFRKLYAKITEPLKAGTQLKVFFADNFPVKDFQ